MQICKNCNTEFTARYKNYDTFCSRSCSASWNNINRGARSQSTKNKISRTLSERGRKQSICSVCSTVFTGYKLTCSKQCAITARVEKFKAKISSGEVRCGGYRKGSGRGKSGIYRGMHLDSTYEIAVVMYYTDHGMLIERNRTGYRYFDPDRGDFFTYYPDFITADGLLEIKGYKTALDDYKLSGVDIPIKILYKSDLTDIFEYAKEKASRPIKRLFELYE